MGLFELVQSIARAVVDGLRRNKLPASLSLIALVFTSILAYTSNFDERPRYRKLILPPIQRAETKFFDAMQEAKAEQTEPWKTLYFLEGHRRARQALQVIQEDRPLTDTGKKAQRELARYYELVDEELAIIRTEMSNNESYDYIAEWEETNSRLLPIREQWLKWLDSPDYELKTSVLH
jgi:hypothetical protein